VWGKAASTAARIRAAFERAAGREFCIRAAFFLKRAPAGRREPQAVEKARYAIFSAETGFTCACGAAGEPRKETLLRKASEPTAHVAGFGLQSEGTEVSARAA